MQKFALLIAFMFVFYPLVHGQDTKSDAEQSKRSTVLNFEVIKTQVLMPYCGSCHIEMDESEYSMETYESLLEGGESEEPGIIPGDLENSPVWTRIDEGDMPPDNLPAPPEDKLELLKRWIEAGAPK